MKRQSGMFKKQAWQMLKFSDRKGTLTDINVPLKVLVSVKSLIIRN